MGKRESMTRTVVLRLGQTGKSSYSQSMNGSYRATSDGWSKAFSRQLFLYTDILVTVLEPISARFDFRRMRSEAPGYFWCITPSKMCCQWHRCTYAGAPQYG